MLKIEELKSGEWIKKFPVDNKGNTYTMVSVPTVRKKKQYYLTRKVKLKYFMPNIKFSCVGLEYFYQIDDTTYAGIVKSICSNVYRVMTFRVKE